MSKYFLFIVILVLTSCLSSKYPTGMSKWEGAVWNCRADSNTIKLDSEIRIKRIDWPSKGTCINCKYTGCSTVPEYFSYAIHWPGHFVFKFGEKKYYFLHNSKQHNPNTKEIAYDFDSGSLNFNKKMKTLTLNSAKYSVVRVYSYEYSRQDSVLTLKLIK